MLMNAAYQEWILNYIQYIVVYVSAHFMQLKLKKKQTKKKQTNKT